MTKWDTSGILRQEIDAAGGRWSFTVTLLHPAFRSFAGITGARCTAYDGKTLQHPKAA
jgi:hypothetical protein